MVMVIVRDSNKHVRIMEIVTIIRIVVIVAETTSNSHSSY